MAGELFLQKGIMFERRNDLSYIFGRFIAQSNHTVHVSEKSSEISGYTLTCQEGHVLGWCLFSLDE